VPTAHKCTRTQNAAHCTPALPSHASASVCLPVGRAEPDSCASPTGTNYYIGTKRYSRYLPGFDHTPRDRPVAASSVVLERLPSAGRSTSARIGAATRADIRAQSCTKHWSAQLKESGTPSSATLGYSGTHVSKVGWDRREVVAVILPLSPVVVEPESRPSAPQFTILPIPSQAKPLSRDPTLSSAQHACTARRGAPCVACLTRKRIKSHCIRYVPTGMCSVRLSRSCATIQLRRERTGGTVAHRRGPIEAPRRAATRHHGFD
jgi:hypothetical protein